MTTVSAQDDRPVKITSDVRVVEVDVTVRDAQGKPVEGLQAKDFTILDNGKPRPFTIFNANGGTSNTDSSMGRSASPVSSTPRPPLPPNTFTNDRVTAPPADTHSTILLLDGMNGWFDTFAHGAQGVEGLMAKVPPDEKIAVYVVAKDLGLIVLQDYTIDRQLLKEKVASFIPRGMKQAPPIGPPPTWPIGGDGSGMVNSAEGGGPPRPAAAPKNPIAAPPDLDPLTWRQGVGKGYDMRRATEDLRLSLKALAAKLRKLPGRKSVFWITEGFPPAELRNMDAAWDSTIAALNDANIQLNTVDAYGLDCCTHRFWGPGGILAQQQIAERTGGTAYFHRNDLDAAMASGIAHARSSYTLGFYLTEIDGKYHELKVRVDRPGLQMNHRQGYYAQTEAAADLAGKKVDLEAALLSPVDATEVGITAGFDIASASPRGLRIIVRDTASGRTGSLTVPLAQVSGAGVPAGH